jgi:hypothetical protein
VQETWLEGYFEQELKNGMKFMHHGPTRQDSARGQGGVGIILSSEAVLDWKKGGSVVFRGGVCTCVMTRSISVTTNIIKSKASTYTSLNIASAYFPDKGKKEEQYQSFCDIVADLTHNTQNNSMIVISDDANAAIGRRERKTYAQVEDPYRNTHANDRGELLLNLMRKCTLEDTLSFHKHKLYDTWVSNFDKQSYAHDHLLVKYNGQKIKINDARVTRVGVQSDHLVIELNMKIKTWRPSKQGRKNKNITRTSQRPRKPKSITKI